MSKNRLIFLIFLGIVLGVGVALYSSKALRTEFFAFINRPSVPSGYNFYDNDTVGMSFNYKKEWGGPIVVSGRDFGDGGYRPLSQSEWVIFTGWEEDFEGKKDRVFLFEGFFAQNPDVVLSTMQADEMIEVESKINKNGVQTIVYNEGGICANKNAIMFSPRFTVLLTGKCAKDSPDREREFDALLESVSY